MDLTRWLEGLGLEQYQHAFRESDVDAAVLPELTADDLIALGVTSIGHRRKLLAAIAALRPATQSALETTAAGSTTLSRAPTAVVGAERRQVTVMFCDLVGSTALSLQLDPEDLWQVIGAYHSCVTQTIGRYNGFVAKYMGDGVLVYFGYPQAHEDDAERAVRAGLALVDAVAAIATANSKLSLRIGIGTGIVVVGDLIGEGSAQEQAVVGETPNLAARLQALAEPNTVVIGPRTRRLLGELFEYRDLGYVELKGFTEPGRAYQVLHQSAIESRFEALHSAQLTPLVGREQEIELLVRRWERAKSGNGQVVLLSGEPGIGKSRIASVLLEKIQTEPHIRLRYFCSPYHQDSALYPIVAQMERAAGFERDDTVDTRLDKLERLLATTSPSKEDVALLADLLALPGSGRYAALDLTPQQKKEKTFEALLRQLEHLAGQQPVLIVFEDLHWIDPTSRELLDRIIQRIERWAALLVATFRPEFQPPWAGQPPVEVLSLNRLSQDHSATLVRLLDDEMAALPSDVADEIVERCDGVPLFIEELTKAVLEETGRPDRARALISALPGTALAVPATLHASLMARLDRLGPPAKETAQIGAAIGREFPFALLAAIAARDEDELLGAIARLVEAGLVFQRGAPPQATFLFKHALVQDAAYGTLLRGPRRLLHARIADALLSPTGERPAIAPEIIAHHLQSAGRAVAAIDHWREAGEQAVRRAANREAIGHLRRALLLLDAQPETAERWRAELAILSRLSPALLSVYGRSAPQVGEAVDRAVQVGRQLETSADLAPSIANLWIFEIARVDLTEPTRFPMICSGSRASLVTRRSCCRRTTLHGLDDCFAACSQKPRSISTPDYRCMTKSAMRITAMSISDTIPRPARWVSVRSCNRRSDIRHGRRSARARPSPWLGDYAMHHRWHTRSGTFVTPRWPEATARPSSLLRQNCCN
jgi:class 3 adenylate cyclase